MELFCRREKVQILNVRWQFTVQLFLSSAQDSELKRTVDESERIKRAYGHYFDLCIVNDGLEAAFRSLRSALDKLSTEHQWVPVSWVFWERHRSEVKVTEMAPKGQQWPAVEDCCKASQSSSASCRTFLYKLSVQANVTLYLLCQKIFCGEGLRVDIRVISAIVWVIWMCVFSYMWK